MLQQYEEADDELRLNMDFIKQLNFADPEELKDVNLSQYLKDK
jgi:mRNA-degrading endonuclease HigB of HigAB toxin-antitoxin module